MRTGLAGAARFLVAMGTALAALGIVHHDLHLRPAVVLGVLALAVLWVVRPAWAALPGFVDVALELGVLVVASLIGAIAHALSYGVAYGVLRAAELTALGGTASLLGVAVATLGYTHVWVARRVEAQQRHLADLQRSALESRLAALTAQIHPHFLFNTLNTLAEVVHEDEDLAEDLVTDLSAMMRYALRSSVKRVPLSEELEVVRRLLRIESARLQDRLTWTLEGDLDAAVTLPGMLVQPLVENAVQHGIASRPEGGRLDIRVHAEDDHVVVEITDDGPGLPDEVRRELEGGTLAERGTAGAGGGLRNTVERLRLTWPDGRATLEVDPEHAGTQLIIRIPVESEP